MASIVWLADAENELDFGIADEDFKVTEVEEKRWHDDIMAHVHVSGQVAPAAAGIIR
jgi:hypothetical protein